MKRIALFLIVVSHNAFVYCCQEVTEAYVAVARVAIDHCCSDPLKTFIRAQLCKGSLRRSEVWRYNERLYADFTVLKPMFGYRPGHMQISYNITVAEPHEDSAKILKNAIQGAWDFVSNDYKGVKSVWIYHQDGSTVVLSGEPLPKKDTKKVVRKLSFGDSALSQPQLKKQKKDSSGSDESSFSDEESGD